MPRGRGSGRRIALYPSVAGSPGQGADQRSTSCLPFTKILRKGAIDDRGIGHALHVRFPLDRLNKALLDVVGLPHQLAVRIAGLVDLPLSLLPPGQELLQIGEGLRKECGCFRAQGYLRCPLGVLL